MNDEARQERTDRVAVKLFEGMASTLRTFILNPTEHDVPANDEEAASLQKLGKAWTFLFQKMNSTDMDSLANIIRGGALERPEAMKSLIHTVDDIMKIHEQNAPKPKSIYCTAKISQRAKDLE